MKNRIINMFFDKAWKRVLIVFFVVFLIILGVGVSSVNYLNDVTSNKNVHAETVVVADKLYGDNPNSDYYIILGKDNKTYGIVNHDGYGQKMFEKIEVGKKYEFIVRYPESTDINQQIHILRAENVTG